MRDDKADVAKLKGSECPFTDCEKQAFFRQVVHRGQHGVIIPRSNVADLMLRADVCDAVNQRLFAVYAIDHADQAIALLSGMPAGAPDAIGLYPEAS